MPRRDSIYYDNENERLGIDKANQVNMNEDGPYYCMQNKFTAITVGLLMHYKLSTNKMLKKISSQQKDSWTTVESALKELS